MTIQGTDKPKLYVTDIPKVLESPEVRNLTKDTIRAAMKKDPIDAVSDLRLALAAVEAWADYVLNSENDNVICGHCGQEYNDSERQAHALNCERG